MSDVKRGNRGIGFDRDVACFAFDFRMLQMQGVVAIRPMLAALQVADEMGPYGRGWSYGMLHRMLRRGSELGLCAGPRPRAAAARTRRAD